MKEKNKDYIIIILVALIIVLSIIIIYLVWNRGKTLKEITGEVIIADRGYVLIEGSDGDYLVENIKETYGVGDKVKFTYKEKNMNDDENPKRIEIEDEILLEKNSQEQEAVDEPEPSSPNSSTKKENTKPNTHPTNEPGILIESDADDEVLTYFDELDAEFKSSSIKDSLKNGFITVVDFLFYDGKIKGHTFKDLSASAKLKVLSYAMYFDNKIDTYFPSYKESISSSSSKIYTSVKENIVSSYLNITTKICEQDAELCSSAKEGFSTIKKNFGLTWSLLKDIAGDGIENIKSWYEIFSGK